MRARSLVAMLAALLLCAVPAQAQARQKKVVKIGWEQDPQTLSPFVDQDEESYRIWAINYDLLVNFSPDDLSPSPGIAENWDVSPDKKTITFTLVEGPSGPTGSRSPARTSSTASRCSAATACCSPATPRTSPRSRRPTRRPSSSRPRSPTRGSSAACSSSSSPSTSGARVPIKKIMANYRPTDPDGGQRPVRGHRVRLQPDRPDGAQPELARRRSRSSTRSSGSSTAAPTPSSAR